jgi:hypothetical protein
MLRRLYRYPQAIISLFVCAAMMPFVSSCGGGGGGGDSILGDLSTDLVISQDTTVPAEVRAKNLTINDGVKVTSTSDLTIHTAGKVTLNGTVTPGGGLTIISAGGMDMGANGKVTGLNGNAIMVDDPAIVPTQQHMNDLFAQDLSIGGPRTKGVHKSRQGGVTWHFTSPYTFHPNARGYHIWINVGADVKVGRGGAAGPPFVQNMPNGFVGPHAPAGSGESCNPVVGSDGGQGGCVAIQADSVEFLGAVVYNLGVGGAGGDAVAGGATSSCCQPKAVGGIGGRTGTIAVKGDEGVDVSLGNVTVNYGGGGAGGDATATSVDFSKSNACPALFCTGPATAIGGKGGNGPKSQSINAGVTAPGNITVNGARGGNGGNAVATGSGGGTSTCCLPLDGTGGKGGSAVATGGAGGPSTSSAAAVGYVGGDGGNATSNGGKGGTGGSCCFPPSQGGTGGKGGDATATGGPAGVGTNAGAVVGVSGGAAGNGGKGGDGNPIGPGGAGGTGSGIAVRNGVAGPNGAPCNVAAACTQEQEPNDSEGTGTVMQPPVNVGDSKCGQGTLSSTTDQDHFRLDLAQGAYTITVNQAPTGSASFFLDIGGGHGLTFPIGTPRSFTISEISAPVWVGFFNGTGPYKFTVMRTQ